ncbi:MAG: YkgJ family cysteine cluster protein [Thermoprotei archaeon]|nr:MAG: YkgJ family cysteine cluster protein [Thermoprotei archaeon]
MILTVEDILTITSLGFELNYFAIFNNGFLRLKNIDGHCVFFDKKLGKCNIYENRPWGCRLYPITYDPVNDEVLIDDYCPRSYEAVSYLKKYGVALLDELRRFYLSALKAKEIYGCRLMK